MKKLVVLGAGESGTGAALLAQAQGYQVFVSDNGPISNCYKQELIAQSIPFEEGHHSLEKILTADEVIKSPGIPEKIPIIQYIKQAKISIIDEIEVASRYTSAFLIGITGTNGKTTTTHLTYHLLKEAGFKVGIAGNMGESFARKVLHHQYDYYVLELSCFQLEGMYNFKADIACLTNITPDHLDRYAYQMDAYIQAKFRILQNMSTQQAFIYNQDDPNIQHYIHAHPLVPTAYPTSLKHSLLKGAYKKGDSLYFGLASQSFEIPINSLTILGDHNQANAMAAVSVATLLGIDPITIKLALQTFQGMPHRIEWVGQIHGINFYDDSKATTVESVYAALMTFQQPIIWIAGGYDKGNDYTLIKPLVKSQVKALICLGKKNQPLLDTFRDLNIPIDETQAMKTAVQLALKSALPGDIVLLSPACASFDLFRNFEDRGQQFKQAVYQAQMDFKSFPYETMDKI